MPRLVFADWLEERGDPRAGWVRDPAVWEWMRPDARPPIPAMLAALRDRQDYQKQWRAQEGLIKLGSPAVPAVRAWAREDWDERWYDAWGIIEASPPPELRPVAELIVQLKAEAWQECWMAVIDLRFHGPAAAAAVPALIAAAKHGHRDAFDGSDDDPLRDAMFTTLGGLGDVALPAVPLLAQRVWWSRAAYDAVLRLRPDPAVVYEHICCDEDSFARTGVRLVRDLDPTRTGMLVRIVQEGGGRASNAAAQILGEMGEEAADAVPALTEALQRPAVEDFALYLRDLVAEALGKIGEPAKGAIPALQAVLAEYEAVAAKGWARSSARDYIRPALAALGAPAPKTRTRKRGRRGAVIGRALTGKP